MAKTLPEVIKRDLRFDVEEANLRAWHPEGLHVSHFFNALSLFFPEGETFFIDSVRHYADRIRSPKAPARGGGIPRPGGYAQPRAPPLQRALAKAGLPAEKLEKKLLKRLDLLRSVAPLADQLAVTIALEHFTAIMANVLLTEPACSPAPIPRCRRSGGGTRSRRPSTRRSPSTSTRS